MFNDKKLHLLLTSSSSAGVKELRLSRALTRMIISAVVLFILASGVMAYLYFSREFDRQKLQKLEVANEKLHDNMKILISHIDTLQSNLQKLEETDKAVRKLENLKPIDEDVRKMGVGGKQFLDSTFYDYDSDIFSTHNSLLKKIESFERRLKFETKSYRKVKKYIEVKNTIYEHTPSIRPTIGFVTAGYGYRLNPFTKKREFHYGLDLAARRGTVVYSAANGTVREIGWDKNYGTYVYIKHGYGYSTFYGHLKNVNISLGDSVTKFQIIGTVGSTGISTGSHLHFEVRFYGRPKNPMYYLDRDKSTVKVAKNLIS